MVSLSQFLWQNCCESFTPSYSLFPSGTFADLGSLGFEPQKFQMEFTRSVITFSTREMFQHLFSSVIVTFTCPSFLCISNFFALPWGSKLPIQDLVLWYLSVAFSWHLLHCGILCWRNSQQRLCYTMFLWVSRCYRVLGRSSGNLVGTGSLVPCT